jgi:AcrR family transcriptional regulator
LVPARGRPRSERARLAVLSAASELLLARGLSAVSMDAVAERAAVSKATIYRWWSSKEQLALDALYERWALAEPAPAEVSDSLREQLLALLMPWADLLRAAPYARVIAELIAAAQRDPVFAERYRAAFVSPRRARALEILRRAVARGELPGDVDPEVALDLIYGAIYHRLLHGHLPLGDDFVTAVVDVTLNGLAKSTVAR